MFFNIHNFEIFFKTDINESFINLYNIFWSNVFFIVLLVIFIIACLNFLLEKTVRLINFLLFCFYILNVIIIVNHFTTCTLSFCNLNLIWNNVNVLLINNLNKYHPALFYFHFYLFLISFFFYMNTLFFFTFFNNTIKLFVLKKKITECFFLSFFYLFLGAWWAFQENSWGGWWNWDPSEVFGLFILICIIFILHASYTPDKAYKLFNVYIFFQLVITMCYYFIQFNFELSSHNFGNRFFFFFNNNFFYLEIIIIILILILFYNHWCNHYHNLYKVIFQNSRNNLFLIFFVFLFIFLIYLLAAYNFLFNFFIWKLFEINLVTKSIVLLRINMFIFLLLYLFMFFSGFILYLINFFIFFFHDFKCRLILLCSFNLSLANLHLILLIFFFLCLFFPYSDIFVFDFSFSLSYFIYNNIIVNSIFNENQLFIFNENQFFLWKNSNTLLFFNFLSFANNFLNDMHNVYLNNFFCILASKIFLSHLIFVFLLFFIFIFMFLKIVKKIVV